MNQFERPVLIADGDIPTTDIVARLMRDAFGTVELVYPHTLQQARLRDRLIVISRLCLPQLAWLPPYLKQAGICYTYFLDDNFYELDAKYDRNNGVFFEHPEVRATLDRFITCAARALVMSPVLAQYLQSRFPELTVCLIAAPTDFELIDRQRTLTATMPGSKLRIGYPSTRRANVAALLTGVVKQVLAQHRDTVEFEFMGWLPDELRECEGVSFLPQVQGYEAYVTKVLSRRWDIAVAPLMDTLFENCKTNLKFREYAAFGVPGVYSAVPLYTGCVQSGQTGLLTKNNEADWVSAIASLLNDPALRTTLAINAREFVQKHHAQPLVAAQLRACLTEPERAK